MFRRTAVMFLSLVLAATVALAGQGPHRARLSADLEQHLASPAVPTVSVIVTGSRDEIAALAARHGLTPKRWLSEGAVLDVAAGSLQALADDEAVAHLSGDVPVRGTMAVTGESIGADQVWAGLEGLKAYSGTGVGIALIDSGVARLPAIASRIVASVDFTAKRKSGAIDEFGHGTHVAGIIAGTATDGPANYSGVAPGANIVNLKVLDANGEGTVSDVIDAIDWAVANREEVQHPDHQPVARPPRVRVGGRRSARARR